MTVDLTIQFVKAKLITTKIVLSSQQSHKETCIKGNYRLPTCVTFPNVWTAFFVKTKVFCHLKSLYFRAFISTFQSFHTIKVTYVYRPSLKDSSDPSSELSWQYLNSKKDLKANLFFSLETK